MLYYDRIHVFEYNDIRSTSESKEQIIFQYWYF